MCEAYSGHCDDGPPEGVWDAVELSAHVHLGVVGQGGEDEAGDADAHHQQQQLLVAVHQGHHDCLDPSRVTGQLGDPDQLEDLKDLVSNCLLARGLQLFFRDCIFWKIIDMIGL